MQKRPIASLTTAFRVFVGVRRRFRPNLLTIFLYALLSRRAERVRGKPENAIENFKCSFDIVEVKHS